MPPLCRHGSIRLPSALFPSFHATREPFLPDVRYPGNIADEAALVPWVATSLARIKPGQKGAPPTPLP